MPQNTTITYGYNQAGQIGGIPNYINAIYYAPNGEWKQITFANGLTTNRNFDINQDYRLMNIDNPHQRLSYTYSPTGDVLTINDKGILNKNSTYTYDDLHRLQTAQINGTNLNYAYTPIGNITQKAGQAYIYNQTHPQAVSQIGQTGISYDGAGNMINKNGQAMSYDAKGRLSSSSNVTNNTTFQYDEQNTRTLKDSASKKNVYLNKYYEIETDKANNTTKKTHYIYIGEEKIASLINGVKKYHLKDHLGSSSIDVNENGIITQSVDYLPYGQDRITNGAGNDYKFTGKEFDEELDMYYYGARYYDPLIGRFASIDPWESLSEICDRKRVRRMADERQGKFCENFKTLVEKF